MYYFMSQRELVDDGGEHSSRNASYEKAAMHEACLLGMATMQADMGAIRRLTIVEVT